MSNARKTRRRAAFFIAAAAAGVAAVSCVSLENLRAGTIRHDRDDRVYQTMAYKDGWQAVGQMLIRLDDVPRPHCSLALIDHQWVLCAAHCIHNFDPLTGFYQEFPPPLVRIGTQLVQLTPTDVFVHPGWITNGSDLGVGYDIALFRLPAPLDRERRRPQPQGRQPPTRQPVDPGRAIIPLRINTERTEVGQRATSVGFGATGTGLTGEAIATSDLRAGVNTIDGTFARPWPDAPARAPRPPALDNTRLLLFDFDSPLTSNLNVLGLADPLNYEYCPARGDSGGPLFLPNDQIAGVVSGGLRPMTNQFSAYGTIAIYTRVSAYRGWIDSVKAGNEPSLAAMIPLLRANGFFPGQPFRGVVTPALRQARENYLKAIASGWVPRTFIGSTTCLQVAESYGRFFPAPFSDREINPFTVPAATSEIEIVTRSRQHLEPDMGWGLDSAFGDVSDLPFDFECVSCGGNPGHEGTQPAPAAHHDGFFDRTPNNDDALQSVLVEPR